MAERIKQGTSERNDAELLNLLSLAKKGDHAAFNQLSLKFAPSLSKIGLTIRGTFGEGTKIKGSLYQLSNQVTLGISEENAIENLKAIAGQIITQERTLRGKLDMDELEDEVYRALGILQNARLLSGDELMDQLSRLRIGISMKLVEGVNLANVNRMLYEAGTSSMQMNTEERLDARKRDKHRAEMARNLFRKEDEHV